MISETTLAFAGTTHAQVRRHLFPGDGCEAAAILLCARTPGPRRRLLVRQALLVPHHECARREPGYITWPGTWIEKAIDAAEADDLALVLIHSHPGGLFAFSDVDDENDQCVMPSLFQALGSIHGSAIMMPNGATRARLYTPEIQTRAVDLVTIVGDDLQFYWGDHQGWSAPERRPLAFTSDMAAELARLSAAVIGVSGTGSIVAEQLTRLGFGRVYLIDYDQVEAKNLNRILNSCVADVEAGRHKVHMFTDAVIGYRGDGVAVPIAASVASREAVLAASQADVLFSCVDTLDARQIADLIASAFLLPLIDVGVVIPVRKVGTGLAIADVAGRVDYVQPDGASLGDRGVYTSGSLRAEHLRRVAPEAHQRELEAGYVKGAVEEAPAVITLNMRAASAAVNEFIARTYPFRLEPNRHYARTEFSLAACEEEFLSEDSFTARPSGVFARGDQEPLLGLPMLRAAL